MVKVALLIGVSEYGSGLNPLPDSVRAVEAMQQVLQPPEIGDFDEVKLLSNPNPPVMREAIETLFADRTKNDIVLLLFVGHLVQDDSNELYLATSITSKSPRAELIRVSAIPISFINELINNSLCQRQVVILDGCLSSISAQDLAANHASRLDIKTRLGGEGRAILSSFRSNQDFFESKDTDHAVYTRYLVEGMRTGAADLDSNGWISIEELHEYASSRVQIAAPDVKPEFYSVEDRHKISLVKSAIDDPKLKYRKEAEHWVRRGEIAETGRYTLDNLVKSLQLTAEQVAVIEAEVLKPYQEYQEKLQRYKREFATTISNKYPLNEQEREKLNGIQQSLGLRDEDVRLMEEQMALKLANLSKSQENTDELTRSTPGSKLNLLPFRSSVARLENTPPPSIPLNHSTPASKEDAEGLPASKIQSEPLTSDLVRPKETPTPPLAPITSTSAVNLSSSLTGSQNSSPASSVFASKFFLPIGIGLAFATATLAIGVLNRTPITPPTTQADIVSSPSPVEPSPQASLPIQKPSKEPLPTPSASPESKVCLVFVNGNLRSEPAGFQENVVESLRALLPVTGKQTEMGWIEVKLPDKKLAWAYRDIISNEEEMKACLAKKEIKVRIIKDIPVPPASSSSNSDNSDDF